jgi:hypothetical protein
MSNGQSALCSCGCGEGPATLAAVTNQPGLPALSYRVGTYGSFLQFMLDRIHSVEVSGTQPLATLTTRDLSDPAIALLDAWAVVADVLTFYEERIANEGYLRTAIERRSILELAREIGYELSPGVAASAYLQFTVEQIVGTQPAINIPGIKTQTAAGPGSAAFNSGIVDVPPGTQVQSVPAPGQLPQTFETSTDFQARVDWNALTPRLTRPQDLALSNGKLYLLGSSAGFSSGAIVSLPGSQVYYLNPLTSHISATGVIAAVEVQQVYLQGTQTGLKTGDRLLLVGSRKGALQTLALIVRNVILDSLNSRTIIQFADNPALPSFAPLSLPSASLKLQNIPFEKSTVTRYILNQSITEGDLQAFVKMNNWNASDLESLINTPPVPPSVDYGAYSFGAKASFYGNNAPAWKTLPNPSSSQRADAYPLDWDAANGGDGRYIFTDSQGNDYAGADAYLDRAYPQVIPNSWILLESPSVPAGAICKVTGVVEKSLADYGLSSRSTGVSFTLEGNVKGLGLSAPSVAAWSANRLDIFAIGLDGNLYHRWWDGSAWNGPQNLGGAILINSPSLVSWTANRLDVFSIGSDGNLYHHYQDAGVWHGPENLGGGQLINSPSAVSWAANRLDIFAIGSDGAFYHKAWNGSAWNVGLENLGGTNLINSPSAVAWAANRLDIFAIGGDGVLYHKWWDGNSWNAGLENLGSGKIANSPSAVAWATNRLDIFAVGSDGVLYHKYWDGKAWNSGFENLGDSTLINSPSAVAWSANRLDVFALSYAGNLHHFYWDGSAWHSQFLSGNGNLMASPSVVAWSADRLDVFETAQNGHWLHHYLNGGSWFGPEDLGNGSLVPFPVRTTTAFVQSEQLVFAGVPVADNIPAQTTSLMLNDFAPGLMPGQPVSLNGMRSDAAGVTVNEIVIVNNIVHAGGFTTLEFATGLQYSYVRSSLTINANVTLATHGATVQEVLGNGDGSQTNQTFTLKRPPLTYVSAPTPNGIANTLQVRVNGLEWQEAPTLYGLDSGDQNYIVCLADDGTPTLTFGDPGSRLKTGQQNVSATYRTGIGLIGNVAAGSLSILQSRQPGLRGVTNPLRASGAADPQNLADARTNAPLTVLTLDRIVSLEDYQSFVQAFAGIGKAQAIEVWSGERRLAHVTVATASGQPIDPSMPLYQTLTQAIKLANDPVQTFIIAGFQSLVFNLKASILIDTPTYEASAVQAAVQSAMATSFSFSKRAFAQAVSAAEVIALIQSIPGIIATNLSQLYLTSDSTGPSQTEPDPFVPSLPARWESGAIQPAQLLLLNPLGVSLTEMPS